MTQGEPQWVAQALVPDELLRDYREAVKQACFEHKKVQRAGDAFVPCSHVM
jgi:hypothetical protein